MSRILIAWELGANYGHLARCVRVAAALRSRGHDVLLAVRDTRGAAEVLAAAGFEFLQAPMAEHLPRLARPPANYSEMLLAEGYGDRLCLQGLVGAWLSLLRLARAEAILADHAPTVLIAAWVAGIPSLAIGNGFAIPPRVSPLPSIREWESIPSARLAQADRMVNDAIHQVAAQFGCASPAGLTDLFGENPLLDTFAELDHYGSRPGGRYIGSIMSFEAARRVAWEGTGDRRIIAYLRPGTAGFPAMVDALKKSGAEVVAVIPGLRPSEAKAIAGPRVRVATAPVALGGLLPDAHAMVGYGGSGTVTESLLAGVPQLVLSRYVEQQMLGLRIEGLGAGLAAGTDRDSGILSAMLERILGETGFRQSARKFANRHHGFTPDAAVDQTVLAVEGKLSGRHPLNS